MEFSVKLEAVALVLIAILALFHFGGQTRNNTRSQMYSWCLLLSAGATFLDIVTTLTILDTSIVPLWFNIVLNTLYFAVMDICLSFVAIYTFYVMFEHVADKHCLRIASRVISIMCIFLLATVVLNLWYGCLFKFVDGVYVRGPLNRAGYYVLAIEVVMLCVCYIRNRQIVSFSMRKMIQSIPPIAFLCIVIQLVIPDVLLNGTMAALVNLIFFINFQSNRIFQDPLTELPNRSVFCQELAMCRKKRQPLHLIMVHLENFGNINRKYGMKIGDEVLYETAQYLDRISSEYQTFRFGNTRFVLMGEFSGSKDAKRCVDEIGRYFLAPLASLNQEFTLHVRIGHMIVENPDLDENSIIDRLEYAVSGVKEVIGTNLVCFDDKVQKMFERREYVLKMIRKSLEEESFEIYYQPVYDCRTGEFSSAESLLRMFGEEGEVISPGEFIPLAEENGMIDEISWLVLSKVCRFLSEHPQIPIRTISVNMSVEQLENLFFVQKVTEIRTRYGVAPERIRIEITERVMSENPQMIYRVMEDMAREGVRFYLDDFGVGYSNLASLLSLPFEIVKMDASLIRGVEQEGKAYDALRLLVEMIHHAGFQVVAEGVETQEQAERAKSLLIDRIQGYYYSRPIPQNDLLVFLECTDK